MKSTYRLLVIIAILAVFTAGAFAQTNSIRWDSDGTKNLTEDGWTLAGTTIDGLTKSRDYSNGQQDPGTNGVWHINDNNSPVAAHMKMYKETPTGVDQSQGMVMARVKAISGSNVNGTFGYSSAVGNHSVVLCVRAGAINWKTAQGGNIYPEPVSLDTTSDYRVYAIRWYTGGTFDAWYTTTNDWSPNASDWVQVVSGGHIADGSEQSALIDETDTARNGLVMGSFGTSTTAWEGSVDYIAWTKNSEYQLPWTFNPRVVIPDDSYYVSDTIPSIMQPGQTYNVSVTLRNSGTNTWTPADGYKLGAVGDSDPFTSITRVDMTTGESIPTYGQKTFSFTMTAPTTEGTYTTDWQMIHEGTGWFGYTLSKQIQVATLSEHDAQYISDTIPATMTAGQTYNVSVTMKNTGSLTWTQAGEIKLGAVDDSDPFAPGRADLSSTDSISTDQQKTFSFTMTAPTTPGTYTTDWRMVHEGVSWFGDVLTKQVEVQSDGLCLVLSDPLLGFTSGTRIGGEWAADGWKVREPVNGTPVGHFDAIFWHLPCPVSKGAVEFSIRGIRPADNRTYMTDKVEIFHMYDYTFNNSDYNYGGAYRDNPFKHFIRKIGPGDTAKVDKMELVWAIQPEFDEPDTGTLSWNESQTYRFREEWGPDGKGRTIFKTYRDGILINTTSLHENWYPKGHSVRIGASTRGDYGAGTYSAPQGAVYSDLKVWSALPQTPTVVFPVNNSTVSTLTPIVKWVGDPHLTCQVRITTTDSPDTGIVWDSGEVSPMRDNPTPPNLTIGYLNNAAGLSNLATYRVFVRTANSCGWSGWSAPGHTFKTDTSYLNPRRGLVRVSGQSMLDDGGKFLALGATYMRGMQRCKYTRWRFERDCAALASQGFNYIRILTMVDWDDLEIAPKTFSQSSGEEVPAWSDYWQQYRDMIDIAYNYGLRTEVTIFAGAGRCMPNSTDQYAHMNSIVANLAGREHKVIQIEVANEYYQNGFPDPGGVTTMRTYGQYLANLTTIPVSLSAPSGSDTDGLLEMYEGSAADIATAHFSRSIGTFEGGWLPVRDCWEVADIYGRIPPVSSNEPIGSGSSVNTEEDPIKLGSAAAFAWIAKLPMYVYHSGSGVDMWTPGAEDDQPFETSAGFSAYRHIVKILPSDLPSWARNDGLQSNAPFTVYCKVPGDTGYGQASTYWTERPTATQGCHRNIGGIKGNQFVCYPQGVLSDGLILKTNYKLTFTVYNPLEGDEAKIYDPATGLEITGRTFEAGAYIKLAQGERAYIIKGTMGDDCTLLPVTHFAANPASGQNRLVWRNPDCYKFIGTKIVCKTTGYPASPADGIMICDRTGSAGTADSFVHSGLSNGTTYYYSAFAYDEGYAYTMAANASGKPASGICFSESFTYPDGPLNGKGGWSGSAASQIAVDSGTLKITGGVSSYDSVWPVNCLGSGGVIMVRAKIKPGIGASNCWSIWIDDSFNWNLARWYGAGTTVRGRIGTGGTVTPAFETLPAGWNTLDVKINTTANTSEFILNGTSLGVLSHTAIPGNSIARIRVERLDYTQATGDYLYFDDLLIGYFDVDYPTAAVGVPSITVTRTGPVSFPVTFSEPVTGFDHPDDVEVHTTGSAAAGSVGITGSGPYTVSLSGITGEGTLAIHVKAGACADAGSNPNKASTVSAAVGVLSEDGSIASAKLQGIDTAVSLGNKSLYLKQGSFGYIEEKDRYSGIRIEGVIGASEGDLVCLTGTMKATPAAEKYILIDKLSPAGTYDLKPLGVTNRWLCSSLMDGLYIKCWGRVAAGSVTANSFVLTDGSDPAGVKIVTQGAPGVSEGDFVMITGAAGFDGSRVVYRKN